MDKCFGAENWIDHIPHPVCAAHPEFNDFYYKAWALAYDHIKHIPGMPQDPYMDEAFCATQVWIWDSCFMSLFCKYAGDVFPGVETLDNFYGVLHEGKKLPKVMPPKEEPDWTGAVFGTPYEIQVHIADNPPLFAWAEYENLLISGNTSRIKELLLERKILQKHYEWIEELSEKIIPDGVMNETWLIAEKDGSGYRWEGGRSGMDNTPRGRTGEHAVGPRPNNPNMLWIDAICQQALSAMMISKLFSAIGDEAQAAEWSTKYEAKKKTVNKLYFDEKDGFYYDIDRVSHEFYKVPTIASYWTLTAGIAPEDRAESLVKQLEDPNKFGGKVPFVSLSRSDADYMPSGRYWRGGVWLPTAYATLRGLEKYGMIDLAHRTSRTLLEHMYRTYTDFEPHTIWEAYDPERYRAATIVEAEGVDVRPDFCGWSALGPIAVYIEFVLGFHYINALENIVKWAKPNDASGEIGIRNLRFGDVVTDITAVDDTCFVSSNAAYTLEVNGKKFEILPGNNEFKL